MKYELIYSRPVVAVHEHQITFTQDELESIVAAYGLTDHKNRQIRFEARFGRELNSSPEQEKKLYTKLAKAVRHEL